MADDAVLAALKAEREAIEQRLAAIDAALSALTGTMPTTTNHFTSRKQVGDDKLDLVRAILKRNARSWVRQADIARETDPPLNPGTVSTALAVLQENGEVERGGKQDRSFTWRLLRS